MLNRKPLDDEQTKQEADRLKAEADQRQIATDLSAVADMKRRYVEPSWRKKKAEG